MVKITITNPKQSVELEVNENDTIKKVKEQYFQKIGSNTNNQWKYDGRIIKHNNQTLKDLGIEDEDKIVVNSEVRGGEVGSMAKMLADPEKKGPVKWKTTYDGPDYLIVRKGINLFGYCQNKNCIAYKKEVCHPFGIGTFDLIQDLNTTSNKCPKCPACEYLLLELETCGFMKCKYHYIGKKYENGKIKELNYSNIISEDHILDYFEAGSNGKNKSLFVELKITASNL